MLPTVSWTWYKTHHSDSSTRNLDSSSCRYKHRPHHHSASKSCIEDSMRLKASLFIAKSEGQNQRKLMRKNYQKQCSTFLLTSMDRHSSRLRSCRYRCCVSTNQRDKNKIKRSNRDARRRVYHGNPRINAANAKTFSRGLGRLPEHSSVRRQWWLLWPFMWS